MGHTFIFELDHLSEAENFGRAYQRLGGKVLKGEPIQR